MNRRKFLSTSITAAVGSVVSGSQLLDLSSPSVEPDWELTETIAINARAHAKAIRHALHYGMGQQKLVEKFGGITSGQLESIMKPVFAASTRSTQMIMTKEVHDIILSTGKVINIKTPVKPYHG